MLNTQTEAQKVKVYLPLVRMISAARAELCPEPFDDVFQVGCEGLLNAIRNYRGEAGDFVPFARSHINGAISHYLAENWGQTAPCKRSVRDLYNRVRRAQRILREQGRELDLDRVAILSGIGLEKWQFVCEEIERSGVPVLSLDAPATAEGEVSLVEALVAPEPVPVVLEPWMVEAWHKIQEAYEGIRRHNPEASLDSVAQAALSGDQWQLIKDAIATYGLSEYHQSPGPGGGVDPAGEPAPPAGRVSCAAGC